MLDANENPLGAPPAAIEAVAEAARTLHRYPRGAHREATAGVADHCGVPETWVVLTSGVDEATDLLLALTDRMTCTSPGFDGFWDRARALQRPVTRIALDDDWQPSVTPDEVAPSGLVALAQPNNPTGNFFDRRWVVAVADRAKLLCVDETYWDFTARPSYLELVPDRGNMCVFRSFSKGFGLAGVRAGAIIAQPRLAALLRDRQRFAAVDSIALRAVAAAVRHPEHLDRARTYVRRWRPSFLDVLRSCGLFEEVRDTEANFVLARCSDTALAARIAALLSEHDVSVRDCAVLGLPAWFRVSVGTPAELDRLVEALGAAHERMGVASGTHRRATR